MLAQGEDCLLSKRHKRRWSLAFTAIYFTTFIAMLAQKEVCVLTKRQIQRWWLAFTAIYFTRVLVSMSKKVLDNQNWLLVRFPSYVAIDVNDATPRDDSMPFQNLDHKKLTEMVKEKSFGYLIQLGGIKGVAAILESKVKDGISGSQVDLARRTNVFGANRYHKPPAKRFIGFVLEELKDTTNSILLLFCAILSLGFGIKQYGWKNGWYDGGSIIVAIFLVVVVSAVSNFKQNRQFEKLSSESSDIRVQVVRDGRPQPVSIYEVVVGDIVSLKIGDQIPADGLFVDGHSLKVDESSMTGLSDHVEIDFSRNPFLLSGTKVTDGYGYILVTSVGMNTAWGEMMCSVSRDELNEQTPLQARLNKLTSYIGKIGLLVAVLVLLVLLIRYFTGNTRADNGKREFKGSKTKLNDVMNSVVGIVAAAVTIVGLPIPEHLAFTLTLAYSMKRMLKDHAMVRKLSACETMGSATTICTDKTGTLTLNEMKVTECWLGKEAFNNINSSEIAPGLLELIQQGVGLNTTGTVYKPHSSSVPEISGSPTEKAILSWAMIDLGMNIDEGKQDCEIIHVEAFNSEKKRSGVLMRRQGSEKAIHTHWKGAAEMILAVCSNYYDRSGTMKAMNDEERAQLGTIIKNMAEKSLRCIAFAHKKITEADGQVTRKLEETGLTLLGLVGLKDPCRPGVRAAVESCRNAGVNIKMITGDNVHTAKAIAIESGILNPTDVSDNDAVVEGEKFRNYSPEERMEKIENIRVLARSSPFDKLLMVQCLKQKGHVVAVTGDGTNDAPALKEADIGLCMGIQGTEVAKESSDIVILDDNFTSVVTVLRWGRCVYENIQKFIQFRLTVYFATLVINVFAALSGKVPLTAVQLLWVNLIMDTLRALALASEHPTNDLMTKPPVGLSKPLVTKVMWRNLIAQALYQVAVIFTLQFNGGSNSLIFHTFVLCQVFNGFNARKLEEKNIFKGIQKNKLFLVINGITVVVLLVLVELHWFANTKRPNWRQWGAGIGMAALSWPIGWLVKWIPVQF